MHRFAFGCCATQLQAAALRLEASKRLLHAIQQFGPVRTPGAYLHRVICLKQCVYVHTALSKPYACGAEIIQIDGTRPAQRMEQAGAVKPIGRVRRHGLDIPLWRGWRLFPAVDSAKLPTAVYVLTEQGDNARRLDKVLLAAAAARAAIAHAPGVAPSPH